MAFSDLVVLYASDPSFIASCAIPLVIILFYRLFLALNASYIPSSLPWASEDSVRSFFPRIRANLLELTQARKWAVDGYRKHSRRGRPFVLPRVNFKPVVVLPPEQLGWLIAQPDNALGNWQELNEVMSLELIMTTDTVIRGPHFFSTYHFQTINQHLTRNLPKLVPIVADELQAALEQRWGNDTEDWKEVSAESITDIITQVISIIFVSKPLCRDAAYIQAAKDYTRLAGQMGFLAGALVPSFLQKFVSPLVTYPARRAGKKYDSIVMPLVKQRLADSKARRANPNASESQPPSDFLQWLIDDVLEKEGPFQQTTEALCTRIGVLNFVSVHTTANHSIDTILDLSVGSNAANNWKTIRDEAESVIAKYENQWNKQAVQDLVIVNSAVRESMRFTNERPVAMDRLVVADHGVTLPTGEHLVKGTSVGTAVGGLYRDEAVYKNADEFKLLRFVNDSKAETDASEGIATVTKNQPFTQPSKEFTPFGYGKHACPGRFFAAQEIKLLIAMIATKYDIEPLKERPSRMEFSINSFPDLNTKFRIKRRKI